MSEDNAPDVAAIAGRLSAGEIHRLIEGRYDWREDDWQDHCGNPACQVCDGLIPEGRPYALSAEDLALRNHLMEKNDVAK